MNNDIQEQLTHLLNMLYNIDDNQVMIYRKLQSIQDDLEYIKSQLPSPENNQRD